MAKPISQTWWAQQWKTAMTTIFRYVPFQVPVTPSSMASRAAQNSVISGLALALVWGTLGFLLFFYRYVFAPAATELEGQVDMATDKVERDLNEWSKEDAAEKGEKGRGRTRRRRVDRSQLAKIVMTRVLVVWPLHLAVATWRAVKAIFWLCFPIPVLPLFVVLTYLLLAVESNQTAAFATADGLVTITRFSGNAAFGTVNVVLDISDAIFLPIWNLFTTFLVLWIRITVKHIGPFLVAGAHNVFDSNGRRLTRTDFDFTGGDDDTDFGKPRGFNDALRMINRVMNIATSMFSAISKILLVLWDLYLTIVLLVPSPFILMLKIISAPACLALDFKCGVLQIIQFAFDQLVALINFLITVVFGSFFGANPIKGRWITVECEDAHNKDDCDKCGSFFEGWKCPRSRRLLSCDLSPEDEWHESVWSNDEVRPEIVGSARGRTLKEGCPMTHRALDTPQGAFQNFMSFKDFECYTVVVNSTVTLIACPPTNATDHHFLQEEPEHLKESRDDDTTWERGGTMDAEFDARYEKSGRRNLGASTSHVPGSEDFSPAHYVSSLVSKNVKILKRPPLKRGDTDDRKTFDDFKRHHATATKEAKRKGLMNCDDVQEGADTASTTWNTMCALHSFILISLDDAEKYSNAASSAAEATFAGRRRSLGGIPDTSRLAHDVLDRIRSLRREFATIHGAITSPFEVHGGRHLFTREENATAEREDAELQNTLLHRVHRRMLAHVNVNPTSHRCPAGYTLCPDALTCTNDCSCRMLPDDDPNLNFARAAKQEEYKAECTMKKFSIQDEITEALDCWNRMDASDAHNPFASLSAPLGSKEEAAFAGQTDALFQQASNDFSSAFDGNGQQNTYCFPTFAKFPFRFPVMTFDLAREVDAACPTSQSASACLCDSRYYDDVFESDAFWLAHVPVHAYFRLYNGAVALKSLFSGTMHWLTGGWFNDAWSWFWSAFHVMPDWWVNAFDSQFNSRTLACIFLHLGSLCITLLNIFIFLLLLEHYFPALWLIGTDIVDAALYLLPDDTLSRERRKAELEWRLKRLHDMATHEETGRPHHKTFGNNVWKNSKLAKRVEAAKKKVGMGKRARGDVNGAASGAA